MKAGRLNRRITVQREIFTNSAVNKEALSEWKDVKNVWAAIEPLRGREFFQTLETHSELTTKIVIRYRSDITTDMRILYGSRIFYIQSVIDLGERHQELQLMCIERNPVGPGE